MRTTPVTYLQEPQADGLGKLWLSADLRGPLDVEALVAALSVVVSRHEALRLRLVRDGDGGLAQCAVPEEPDIELLQPECDSPAEFAEHVSAHLAEEMDTPWDLTEEPPARFFLFRFTPEHHTLGAVFSRFAVDGRSQRIFAAELWAAYRALHAGEEFAGPPAPSFLAAAKRSMDQHRRRVPANLAYWRKVLAPAGEFGPFGELQARSGGLSTVGDLHVPARSGTAFDGMLARLADVVVGAADVPRLVVLVSNDFRTVEDRDVLGAFARPVPVVLDRAPATPDQVQRSVLRARIHGYVPASAMADCSRALEQRTGVSVPAAMFLSYLDHTERAAEPARVGDLSIGRGPGVPGDLLSAPMLDVMATVQEAGTHVRLVLNSGVFPADLAEAVTTRLASSLGAEPARV